jgi:hypothetical protein
VINPALKKNFNSRSVYKYQMNKIDIFVANIQPSHEFTTALTVRLEGVQCRALEDTHFGQKTYFG